MAQQIHKRAEQSHQKKRKNMEKIQTGLSVACIHEEKEHMQYATHLS